MQGLKKLVKTKKIKTFLLLIIVSLLLSFSIFFIVFSAPPTSPYAPGETLNPSCSPGDLNCTVSPPLPTYISTTTIVELNNNLLSFNTGTVKILGELIVTNTTTFNGISYRWPLTSPNANQFLQADGSGGLQWVDITSSTSGGWTDEGTVVRLQTITDSVAIGTTTQIGKFIVATGTQIGLVINNLGLIGIGTTIPAYKLDVNGDLRVVATTTLGSATSTPIIFTGYIQSGIIPYSDLNYSLGSSSNRWANIYSGTTTISNALILSSLIPGSVLFAGSGGQINQNNSNFYWDNTNLRLGIGTSTPAAKLHIIGDLIVSATSSLGTITSGIWQGSVIGINYGGTGLSALGSANQILGVNTSATALEYKNISSLLTASSGISITGTTTVTISNTGVLSLNSLTGALTLQGTANQINVSSGGSIITLSTPQDIATTSSPTFSGLTLAGHLLPSTNLTYDLGSSTLKWSNLYVGTTTIGSTTTITIGANTFEGTGTTTLFTTGNANQLVLGYNGNIGIGTSTPSQKLTVEGNIGLSGAIGSRFIGTINNIALSLRTNNTDRIYITAGGNVGIGVTAPSSLLELYSATTSPILTITSATSTTYSPQIQFRTGGGIPTTRYTIGTNISDDTLKLVRGSITGSTGITINSSGYVGIGTSTPVSTLQIVGTTTARDILPEVDNTYTLGSLGKRWSNIYTVTTSVGDLVFANNFRIVEFNSTDCGLFGENCNLQGINLKNHNNLDILSIDENGNLKLRGEIFARGYNVYSSKEYKENIRKFDDSQTLEKLQNLNFYQYNYIGSTSTHIGVIAEDAPKEILSDDGKAINLYKFVSFIGFSVKSLANKVADVGNSLVVALKNSILEVKELIANILRVKNIKELESFEMKDKATGEIYCVVLEYGEFRKVKGSCDENNSSGQNNNSNETTSSSSQGSLDSSLNNQADLNSSVNQEVSNSSTSNQDNSDSTSSSAQDSSNSLESQGGGQ